MEKVDPMKETMYLVDRILNQKYAAESFIIREGLWEKYQTELKQLLQEVQQLSGTDTYVSKS